MMLVALALLGLLAMNFVAADVRLRRDLQVALALLVLSALVWQATLRRAQANLEASLLDERLWAIAATLAATLGLLALVRRGPKTWCRNVFVVVASAAAAQLAAQWLSPTHKVDPPGGSWIDEVRSGLGAEARGAHEGSMHHVAVAACQGAEPETLRSLCGTAPHRALAPHALGADICRAVGASMAEEGARALGCKPHPEGDRIGDHRCRLAGELLAEAGLIEDALLALKRAHGWGVRSAWAVARSRNLPQEALDAEAVTDGALVWPHPETIGPNQIGLALGDAPGSLIWHPQAAGAVAPASWAKSRDAQGPPPGQKGVLRARSPYHGALVTHVPGPSGPQKARGVALALLAREDVRLTFLGPGGRHTLCCRAPGQEGCHGSLPEALCAGAWGAANVQPPKEFGPITSATIHGEYLLGHWLWLLCPRMPR